MIQRRARAAGVTTKIGSHTFRATQLCDRSAEEMTLKEVERIGI
jgi:hypothetical protein